MNAEELAASIIADARQKAIDIEKSTMEEVHTYEEETRRIIGERKQKMMNDARQQEKDEHARKVAQYERERVIETLRIKQGLINDVFATAGERLTALKGQQREKLLQTLWDRVRSQMRVKTVEVAKKDTAFFKKRASVTASLESMGGFIATNADKTVSIDMRFETLLATVREQKLQEVAGVLFAQ